ncbi:MAG: hypothetical protein U0793_09020 [Gemmataceae bacterium]
MIRQTVTVILVLAPLAFSVWLFFRDDTEYWHFLAVGGGQGVLVGRHLAMAWSDGRSACCGCLVAHPPFIVFLVVGCLYGMA